MISEAEIAQDPERRFQSVLDRWNKGDRSLETGLKYFAKYPTASDEFDDFYLQLSPIEQCDTTLQIMLVFRMRLDSDAKVIDYIASNWKNQYESSLHADYWKMLLPKSFKQQLEKAKGSDAFDNVCDRWREYELPFTDEDIAMMVCARYFEKGEYDRGYEALDDLMEKYPTAFPGILSKFYDLASSVNVPSEERRKIWMDYVEKFLIENTPMAVPMKEMFEYLVSPLRK